MSSSLKLSKNIALHSVFHVSLLLLHKKSWHPPKPATIEVEDEEEYEVEAVLDSQQYEQWKKLQYLVHWKGWGPEHDSWKDMADLRNAPQAIQKFHFTHSKAPSPLNKKTWSWRPDP